MGARVACSRNVKKSISSGLQPSVRIGILDCKLGKLIRDTACASLRLWSPPSALRPRSPGPWTLPMHTALIETRFFERNYSTLTYSQQQKLELN